MLNKACVKRSEMKQKLRCVLRSIYRKTIQHFLSHRLRTYISNFNINNNMERVRARKELLKNKNHLTPEEKKTVEYLKKNLYGMFGYDGMNEYDSRKGLAVREAQTGLCYVPFSGKRLYFKRDMPKNVASGSFNELSAEMDIRSPHRYVTSENKIIGTITRPEESEYKGFCVKEGDVVADVGCAEGNFSISVVDIAAHVYLFECDPDWIEALEHTFKDFRDKITIINKYVSDNNTDATVTLDAFFKDKKINFIKADIEGAEESMLHGAKELLSMRKDLKLAVCTYHKANDFNEFEKFLNDMGYKTSYPKGMMFFTHDKTPPYLRRGVIRAERPE